jgi:hypothetical protein
LQRTPTISDDFEASQSNSRLFVLLGLALLGLICIGLVGLGAIFAYNRANRAQEAAVAQEPPTALPPTFTPTSTATATPTETPLPTPTGTLVVGPTASRTPGGNQALPTSTLRPGEAAATLDPNVTPTNTLVVQPTVPGTPEAAGAATQVVPDSGGVLQVSRTVLLWVGGSLLLVLLLYGANYHSKSS